MMTAGNESSIAQVFVRNALKYGAMPCASFKKEAGFHDISWEGMLGLVRGLAGYLIMRGVKKGDRVAIFSRNRPEWYAADMASLAVGAAVVPVFTTSSTAEAAYMLEHSGAKLCFAGSPHELKKLEKIGRDGGSLREVIAFDDVKGQARNGVTSFAAAVEQGALRGDMAAFEKRLKSIKSQDLAGIIYTSGTTGEPKGVMLSHGNFMANVMQIQSVLGGVIAEGDVFLSILPLSHVYERTAGFYWPVCAGARIAYSESFRTVLDDLRGVRPQWLVSVPRLYEKIHAGVVVAMAQAPAFRKALFEWSMRLARRNVPFASNGSRREGLFDLLYRVADSLVYSKLREAFGLDQLRCAISGGGPLSIADAEFFLGIGVTLLEGFGMTETSPVTNVNRPGMIKPGSVGPAFEDTQVRISDEGELLVRGPQVMMGYYRNRVATRHAFTRDGFFKSGDLAAMDGEGRITIMGRLKDIIVTSGGKNIAPQMIESRVRQSKFVSQVALVGDRRKYVTALIIPDFAQLGRWARARRIEYSSNKELISDERTINMISAEIEKLTREFSQVERIKRFRLIDDVWSQESGDLTPTMKVKRRVIERKYAREIASMYPVEIN